MLRCVGFFCVVSCRIVSCRVLSCRVLSCRVHKPTQSRLYSHYIREMALLCFTLSFTAVSYNRDRYPSESSEENLADRTGRPSRPTRLEIGRPMPREVVITPDRNEETKPKTFAATPSSPVNKGKVVIFQIHLK